MPCPAQSLAVAGAVAAPGATEYKDLMQTLTKTYSAKPGEIPRQWYLVDAADKILGRLASEIAKRLQGKHKPGYTPHVDSGDYIVIVNAERVQVSGNKRKNKIYYRHSGYPGGLKSDSFEQLIEKQPDRVLKLAVKRMLPKGPLGRAMFRKLKVYVGTAHRHAAQQPTPLELG